MAHNVYSRRVQASANRAPAIFTSYLSAAEFMLPLPPTWTEMGDPGLLWEAADVSYKGYAKGETLYARAVHSTDSNAGHAIARTANCQAVPLRESVRGPAHQYCRASNRVHEVNVYAHDDRVDAVDDVEIATQKESVVS
jgi:hypothetical protein